MGIEDMARGALWLSEHRAHVERLIKLRKGGTVGYEPTATYDIHRPEVWRPEHWLWFLREIDQTED